MELNEGQRWEADFIYNALSRLQERLGEMTDADVLYSVGQSFVWRDDFRRLGERYSQILKERGIPMVGPQ